MIQIQSLSVHKYEIPLTNNQTRTGALIKITGTNGMYGFGEMAPLTNWSQETLDDSLGQLGFKLCQIMKIYWTAKTYLEELSKLKLCPSLSFGLESALFRILTPHISFKVPTSALIMGTLDEILELAGKRHSEGFTSAKLKVSNLSFEDAKQAIDQLKDLFRLRIDVNRAWETDDAIQFFSKYSIDAFDYVEEPFKNPKDLKFFTHPLAIDESFPKDLTLDELESLPTLAALIYKPTIQGGMLECLPIYEWTKKKNIKFVLSSCFESDIGLMHIASMADRLRLQAPIGIGTYHYLAEFICAKPFQILGSKACIPSNIRPKFKFLD